MAGIVLYYKRVNQMDMTICRSVYDEVCVKLGANFITPNQIEEAFGWKYTPEQHADLQASLTAGVISAVQCDNALLLPLPPQCMSLYALFSFGREGMVYRYRNYRYANETLTRPGNWLSFPRQVRLATGKLTYHEQCVLLEPGEKVPNAAEIAYVIAAFRETYEHLLYEGVYLRSTTQYLPDCNVVVGCSDGGISMQDMYNDSRLENVRLAAARFI